MYIERYTPRWHDAVIGLTDRVFGEGYFQHPWELATEPGSVMLVGFGGERELVGFAHGQLLAKAGLWNYLEHRVLEIPDEIAEADSSGALGVIQALAVAPDRRRQRIGTKLLTVIHDTLVGEGADKLIATFKRGSSATPIEGMMQKVGFQLWISLPSYWKPQCDRREFRCVDRQEECSCIAMLYRKVVY